VISEHQISKSSWGGILLYPPTIGMLMHAFCQANAWPYHFILACSGTEAPELHDYCQNVAYTWQELWVRLK